MAGGGKRSLGWGKVMRQTKAGLFGSPLKMDTDKICSFLAKVEMYVQWHAAKRPSAMPSKPVPRPASAVGALFRPIHERHVWQLCTNPHLAYQTTVSVQYDTSWQAGLAWKGTRGWGPELLGPVWGGRHGQGCDDAQPPRVGDGRRQRCVPHVVHPLGA